MNGVQSVHTDSNSLLKAVYLGRLRLTRLLLEGGAYINESNEHGETPLMIACKSRYSDTQGVPKAKIVGYLLESGADPNIQDKSGKTALMHACLEKAGPEVVTLLLESGADPCLQDHEGSSALIYAIHSNYEETLKLLIDAFKAKGKEVIIIITTDRLASGKLMAEESLQVPLHDQRDKSYTSSIPCASPSEIHLSTSPQETLFSNPSKQIFYFQDPQITAKSQAGLTPNQPIADRRLNKVHQLQRLHSEPWLKIPQSFLAQQQAKGMAQMKELPDPTAEEELAFSIDGQVTFVPPLSCQGSADLKGATNLTRTQPQKNNNAPISSLKPEAALPRNASFNGLSSLYSLSHPDLHSKSSEFLPSESDSEKLPPHLAVSGLMNIIQRRKLGMDHYGSDSQLSLSGSPAGGKKPLDTGQLLTSRSSTLINSQESNDSPFLGIVHKHHPTNLERRGSGALLTDPPFNPRPAFLPPLNHHTVTPQTTRAGNSNAICSGNRPTRGFGTGTKQYLPSAPAGLPKDLITRRMLMRRHSMQPEQIKQLGVNNG